MAEEETERKKPRPARKITRQRLKNIALYYLQRFETSSENLKAVLLRRVNVYAFQNPDWNRQEAVGWIDEIVAQFEGYGYVDDARFAEMKIKDYLAAGKSVRYIKGKLQLKGIDENMVDSLLEGQDYDEYEAALHLAKKKTGKKKWERWCAPASAMIRRKKLWIWRLSANLDKFCLKL